MPDYDVIVIGGGSAGTSAAAAARRAGARTLLVNDGELGGLCILRGCMPTKAMLATAHAVHVARGLEPFGATLDGRVTVDFPRVMRRKDEQVARFQRAKIASVERQDYDVTFGRARFGPGGSFEIDGRPASARSWVVATGSVPERIPIAGDDDVPVWTSDDVMRLDTAPRSLVVQGAGPIGLELAQFFARIGTRVLLVNRSPLLARLDADCGAELDRALRTEPGLELAVPGRIERLERAGSGLVAHVTAGERAVRFEAEGLLLAVGRRPAIDGLGLEHLGIDTHLGIVRVDEGMRGEHPRVWFAGDATGRFQILHLANREGTVAGHNAAGGDPPMRMDYRLKMAVVFTDPPFAQVGLCETEAAAAGEDVVVGRAWFAETGRAITMGVEHGLWKLFARRGDGAILGSAILGPRADDLVHLVATLMHYGAAARDVCELPWYHPTLSEVMLNLSRDVAEQRHEPLDAPGMSPLPPGYSATLREP